MNKEKTKEVFVVTAICIATLVLLSCIMQMCAKIFL